MSAAIEGLVRGRVWRSILDECVDHEREEMGGFGPFERWKLMERSPERVRRLLEKARTDPWLQAVAAPFAAPVGQPVANPSSHTTVNNTNVETNLWVPAIWTPIPVNDMLAGRIYNHRSGGVLGTSSAAPTLVWTPRCGQSATPASNITLGASTATTMIASLSAVPWRSEFDFTLRALGLAASGASGTGNGLVIMGGITTAAGIVQAIGATVFTTVDNTAATGYVLSVTWGTTQANNTCTAQWTSPVRSLN